MSWIASRTGASIELVTPKVEEVDFDDIAWSLAHTSRYIGHGEIPVSEALHLMIGLGLMTADLRPHWLISTAYKTRLGGIEHQTKLALAEIAGSLGPDCGSIFNTTISEFQTRHSKVIHEAAGLPLPDVKQHNIMFHVHRRCEATEHRDFHRTDGPEWLDIANVKPSPQVWKFRPADKVYEALRNHFRTYIPALCGGL